VDYAGGAAAGLVVGALGEIGLQKQAGELHNYLAKNGGAANSKAYVDGMNLTAMK
jgi:hypothetical protein